MPLLRLHIAGWRGLIAPLVPAIVFLACASALATAQPREALLRAQIAVHGDLVTLGDLFENAGQAATVAVFRAPDLGTQGVVAAKRVATAAERNGLAWSNPDGLDQVAVRRPSRLVSVDEISSLLRDRVAAELGVDDQASIEIALPRTAKPIHVDPQLAEPVVVKRLNFDARTGSFLATVGLQEASRETPDLTYQGRAIETAEIAMPVRDIERAAVIAAEDVKLTRIPRNQLPSDAIADLQPLVGMAARHRLTAGRPVRQSDVERPKLVQRNAIVTIVYQVPGLMVKSTGRALGDGALGETVTILNTQSKRTIIAEVAGPGEVRVTTNGPDASPPARQASGSGGPGAPYLVR